MPIYILQLANSIYKEHWPTLSDALKETRSLPAHVPPSLMDAARRIAQLRRDAEELAKELRDAISKEVANLPEFDQKTTIRATAATSLKKAADELEAYRIGSAESKCETLRALQEAPEFERKEWLESDIEPVPLSDAHASRYEAFFTETIELLDRFGKDEGGTGWPGGNGDGSEAPSKTYTPPQQQNSPRAR